MLFEALPTTYDETREVLHRVATHVLARRRFERCGKFGLRATPGGFGTPACGGDHEVIRISGTTLVRETTGVTASTGLLDLCSASLADAASFVGVDLAAGFEAWHDTPAIGDPHALLAIDPVAVGVVADWLNFGWSVLDTALGELGADAAPSVVQLWPEHFDIGVDLAPAAGRRANFGASLGDSYSAQPYLYVGPWDSERPGDPRYWNAPFGAILTREELRTGSHPDAAGLEFLLRGASLLR